MHIKMLTADSPDIEMLEQINEEAIPACERNSLKDLMATDAMVIEILEEEPVGFLVIREFKTIIYLAYLAVRRDRRCKGIGGEALRELISEYYDRMIVVEYEAPDPSSSENDLKFRRKGFYHRNGFLESGYYTFYDDTEFEIGFAGEAFDFDLFCEFTEYLCTIVSDHIPKPYRKEYT